MNWKILLLAAFAAGPLPAADYGALAPFESLAGHCWRGEIEKTGAVDTHCFTWVYDGKHLRDVHVVRGSGPDYRGESVYSVDAATGDVVFRYWNSLGGTSGGRIRFEDGVILAPGETYTGEDGRLREFESSLRRLGEDSYETRTAERVGNEWQEKRRVVFRRVSAAPEDQRLRCPGRDPDSVR